MTDTPDSSPKSGDALWQYWFSLKTDARARSWETLRQRLAYEPDHQLPAHPFVTEVFHAAANAGEADIVETLFERGFSQDAETLAETTKRLAIYHANTAVGVIRFLLAPPQSADPTDAIYAAAAEGRIDSLQTLSDAGADVRAGHSAFFLALYKGHPAAMHYLYEKGSELYHPAMLAAQYGRQKELPSEKAAIALSVYRDLVDIDNQPLADLYAAAGPAQSVADLREKIGDENGGVYTRLQLAIRAGKWDDVKAAAAQDKTDTLRADDFLAEDAKGQRALNIMAARGQLADVFNAAVWYRAPQEAARLDNSLSDFRAAGAINMPSMTAEMQRMELRDIAPPADSFRLKPRSRKP